VVDAEFEEVNPNAESSDAGSDEEAKKDG